jgi:hypothetical protein
MVTSAAWVDYDHDGRLDLVVTGEWMPVRVFRQEGGRFVERTSEAGFKASNGWWDSITIADVNGDGRADLVLGNLGLNAYIAASPTEPARLYVGDFAHNRSMQPILTAYKAGVSYPVAGRDELLRAVPTLGDKYPSYASFGARRIEQIFSRSELERAKVLEAYDFATSVAMDNGNGGFTLRALPMEAQFAPVRSAIASDLDGDGHTDLLLAGNDFGVPPVFGRHDASYGVVLRGDGGGHFEVVDFSRTALVLDGQARHIKVLRQASGGRLIVVARNDDTLQVLRLTLPLLSSPGAKRPQ